MPARAWVERDLLDRVAMEITRVQGDEDAFGRLTRRSSRNSRDSEAALGFAASAGVEGLGVYHPPNLQTGFRRDRGCPGLAAGVLYQSPLPMSFSSAFLKGILGGATEDLGDGAGGCEEFGDGSDMNGGAENLCLTFVEEEENTLPASR